MKPDPSKAGRYKNHISLLILMLQGGEDGERLRIIAASGHTGYKH